MRQGGDISNWQGIITAMRLAAAGIKDPEREYQSVVGPLIRASNASLWLNPNSSSIALPDEYVAPAAGDVSCWRQHGWDTMIIRASLETTNKSDLALQQMDVCLRGGMDVSVYGWVYWDWSPTQTARWVSELIGSRPIRWVWWDMEEEAGVPNAAGIVTWLKEAIAETERLGLNSGIYTGLWWYNKYLRGNTDLAYRPLWDANYSQQPFSGLVRYGGWDPRLVFAHQFSSSYQICGRELDANGFSESYYLFPPRGQVQPPPPPDHNHEEIKRRIIEELFADSDNPSEIRKILHAAWITEQMHGRINGAANAHEGENIKDKLRKIGFDGM